MQPKHLLQEKGSALVMTVVVLVALTIIGLGAVTSSNLTIDASGNLRAKTTAFHAAEACLYYQIKRIKVSGPGTTALTNYALGNNVTCSASVPVIIGGAGSGGTIVLTGYSLEEGSASVSYVSYQFDVTGFGPRNTQSKMDIVINIPTAGGGY